MSNLDLGHVETSSPETSDFPSFLMGEIRGKTTIILWTPKIIPIQRKNVEKFQVDWWYIYITRDWRWLEIIYFISPLYTGNNHSIFLYKNRDYKWKMMIKIRNDSTWENFIRERIEKNDFETWFELPKTTIISSSPPDWAYYHPMRDNNIAEYVEKRRALWECFFFKTYEEYLQLKREWFISEELVENKIYTIKVMYTGGKADEYYTLTGLLSCEPTTLSLRPGKDYDRSVDIVLRAEGVDGWEILGIFPPPIDTENVA